jgi:hypothetical protein
VPRAKLPAASEPALAALTEPLRIVLCCRMASTFDPERPAANDGFAVPSGTSFVAHACEHYLQFK